MSTRPPSEPPTSVGVTFEATPPGDVDVSFEATEEPNIYIEIKNRDAGSFFAAANVMDDPSPEILAKRLISAVAFNATLKDEGNRITAVGGKLSEDDVRRLAAHINFKIVDENGANTAKLREIKMPSSAWQESTVTGTKFSEAEGLAALEFFMYTLALAGDEKFTTKYAKIVGIYPPKGATEIVTREAKVQQLYDLMDEIQQHYEVQPIGSTDEDYIRLNAEIPQILRFLVELGAKPTVVPVTMAKSSSTVAPPVVLASAPSSVAAMIEEPVADIYLVQSTTDSKVYIYANPEGDDASVNAQRWIVARATEEFIRGRPTPEFNIELLTRGNSWIFAVINNTDPRAAALRRAAFPSVTLPIWREPAGGTYTEQQIIAAMEPFIYSLPHEYAKYSAQYAHIAGLYKPEGKEFTGNKLNALAEIMRDIQPLLATLPEDYIPTKADMQAAHQAIFTFLTTKAGAKLAAVATSASGLPVTMPSPPPFSPPVFRTGTGTATVEVEIEEVGDVMASVLPTAAPTAGSKPTTIPGSHPGPGFAAPPPPSSPKPSAKPWRAGSGLGTAPAAGDLRQAAYDLFHHEGRAEYTGGLRKTTLSVYSDDTRTKEILSISSSNNANLHDGAQQAWEDLHAAMVKAGETHHTVNLGNDPQGGPNTAALQQRAEAFIKAYLQQPTSTTPITFTVENEWSKEAIAAAVTKLKSDPTYASDHNAQAALDSIANQNAAPPTTPTPRRSWFRT